MSKEFSARLKSKEQNYFKNNTPSKQKILDSIENNPDIDEILEDQLLDLVKKQYLNFSKLVLEGEVGNFDVFAGFCETLNEEKLVSF